MKVNTADKIFDLENDIMNCWNVTEDINTVTEHFYDSEEWKDMDPKLSDALANKYFGIKELYDVKFQKLFKTFEAVCKEYHQMRRGNNEG